MLATGFAVQATLRMHGEESALRAEPLLATPLSRGRWAASHLVIAAVGSTVALLVANLGTALTYGLIIGDFSTLPDLVAATFPYLPAMWVLIGVGTLLYGLRPRAVLATWGVFAAVAPGRHAGRPAPAPGLDPLPVTAPARPPRAGGAACSGSHWRSCCAIAVALTAAGLVRLPPPRHASLSPPGGAPCDPSAPRRRKAGTTALREADPTMLAPLPSASRPGSAVGGREAADGAVRQWGEPS